MALPSVLDDSPAVAHIGGQTATLGDIGGRVTKRLPTWLDRLLPKIDIEGESGLPTPEMESVAVAGAHA